MPALPQFGFLVALSGCSQEHGQGVVSHSIARLAVHGKVLSWSSCCMGTFWLYYLVCCLKQFNKIWVHTLFWSKAVCFPPVENDCGKMHWEIIQERNGIFIHEIYKWLIHLQSFSHIFYSLYFTHILTSPRMHVPRWSGSLVWHKGHGTSNPYRISWHFPRWQPWTNFLGRCFVPSRSPLLLCGCPLLWIFFSSVSKS